MSLLENVEKLTRPQIHTFIFQHCFVNLSILACFQSMLECLLHLSSGGYSGVQKQAHGLSLRHVEGILISNRDHENFCLTTILWENFRRKAQNCSIIKYLFKTPIVWNIEKLVDVVKLQWATYATVNRPASYIVVFVDAFK